MGKNSASWARSAILHGIYCIFHWVNFANLRLREKKNAFDAKIVNISVWWKFSLPFLLPTKSCQVLPPCSRIRISMILAMAFYLQEWDRGSGRTGDIQRFRKHTDHEPKYTHVFFCSYALGRYPFDRQICSIDMTTANLDAPTMSLIPKHLWMVQKPDMTFILYGQMGLWPQGWIPPRRWN